MNDLQCVVVTPERTELDLKADSVTVPLYDGEMGILKGHSPLVGRLGYGVLRIKSAEGTKSYFVDGGFVQVSKNVISVLTDRVVGTDQITPASAEQALKAALELPFHKSDLAVIREKACSRARAMVRVAASKR
jgi:F-type H+-transporting ATPase subunit epsilon